MGTGLFAFASKLLPLFLYLFTILVVLWSLFKNSKYGIYYLVCIVPLTNILIKIQKFPLGSQVTNMVFLAVLIGTYIQGGKLSRTKSTKIINLLFFLTVINYFVGFIDFGITYRMDHVARLQTLKNYLIMIFYYYIAYANLKTHKDIKYLIYLMLFITLLVGWRYWESARWLSTTHFSYDKRVSGAFGYLGANHMATFLVQYAVLAFGIMMYQKKKLHAYAIFIVFSAIVSINLYTYSRASYLALALAIFYFGLFRIKKMIVGIVILLIFGSALVTFLPQSVVERVSQTETEDGEIESSANTRLELWTEAYHVFSQSPIIGVGYQMFPSYVRFNGLSNTHNYFMQTLCEMGIVGIILLLKLFHSAYKSGRTLHKMSKNDFSKGLGLGFCGCVIVCVVCNFFGDRWSFFQIQGYFWMIWAIADKYSAGEIDGVDQNLV